MKNGRLFSGLLTTALAAVFVMTFAGHSWAQEPAKDTPQKQSGKTGGHWLLNTELGGRLNPQGLYVSGALNYRNVYGYDSRDDMVTSYWQTGVGLAVSPSMSRASARFEWMPWLFLPLKLEYDYDRYFGRSWGLLSFPSARSSISDDAIKQKSDRNEEVATDGLRILFQPTLQAKIGPVYLRNQTDLAYYFFSGKGPYFLDLEYYTLLKDRDLLVSNETSMLFEIWKGSRNRILLAGPYYEVTRARDAEITQQKVGIAFSFTPWDTIGMLDKPYLQIKLGYYLEDPDRQQQVYLLIGMGFDIHLR